MILLPVFSTYERLHSKLNLGLFNIVNYRAFVRYQAPTFSKVWQNYIVIGIQIITGFDHICCIKNTKKSKYNENTKYIGNIHFHKAVCYLLHQFICDNFELYRHHKLIANNLWWRYIQLEIIINNSKLTQSLRTSRGTDELLQQLYENVCFLYISCTHYISIFLYFGYNKYGQNMWLFVSQ